MLLFTVIIEGKGMYGVNTGVGIRLDICAVESDLGLSLVSTT